MRRSRSNTSTGGFRPDFILPHSLGEFAALAVSGMADFAETAQFVCRRALVIDSIKERGVMLHAEAPLDFAEELASRHTAELSVAAVNGARSVVLSGTAEAARSAERALDAAKIPHRRLRVPYAAHSPLASQIAEKIAALPFPALNEPFCPVFSSIDGNPLTAAEVSRPARRAEQCLRPARFDKLSPRHGTSRKARKSPQSSSAYTARSRARGSPRFRKAAGSARRR